MKTCPFCAEDIQDEAIKCKHCGSMLDGSDQGSPTAQPTQPVTPAEPTDIKNPRIGKPEMVVGGVIVVLGVVIMFGIDLTLGVIVGGIGSVIFLYGKIRNWWHWR